jgi:hypothetical protein
MERRRFTREYKLEAVRLIKDRSEVQTPRFGSRRSRPRRGLSEMRPPRGFARRQSFLASQRGLVFEQQGEPR